LAINNAQIHLGDSISQYVGTDDSGYLHGGCDLVVPAGTSIVAPVDGDVDVNFYEVQQDKLGNVVFARQPFEKIPEKIQRHALTTEVLIKTTGGYQFLFHHVDPRTIPEQLLNNGQKNIVAGTSIGQVPKWPIRKLGHDYSHVHYAIISPSGETLNCQYYSIPLPDRKAPKILGVFKADSSGRLIEVRPNQVISRPSSLVIQAEDQIDFSPFKQPPSRVGVTLGGLTYEWDFRTALSDSQGTPIMMKNLYLSGRTVSDYWSIAHYFLLKLPDGRGAFTVFAEDVYGNRTEFNGRVK
jgi:hypothetical protein